MADNVEMQGIEFQIVNDSDDAAESLERLEKVLDKLVDAIKPLTTRIDKLSDNFSSLKNKTNKVSNSLDKYSKTAQKAANGTSIFKKIIDSISLKKIASVAGKILDTSIDFEGISSRFGRAFGEYATENYEWIRRLNDEMHINTQEFMQFSSIYATMLEGYGVAQKDASKMAMGYTELAYDIWAGYNDIFSSFEDAAVAVRSAIAGETEPIQRAGFTIVDSQLKITAANHGVEYSTQGATQELKSYLRYLTLVDQASSQNLVGTFASEMNTAEGMARMLKQQLVSLTQAISSLFLPIVVKVLPYIQAFVELLNDAIVAIAGFFGITIQKVDFSGAFGNAASATDEIASGMDNAAGSAKELKRYLAGFDELNVLPEQNSGSGGSAGGGVGSGNYSDAFDIQKLWDESIFDKVQTKVDEIKAKLQPFVEWIKENLGTILGIATTLAAVFLGWALSEGFLKGIESAKGLSSIGQIAIGAALTITGFTIEFTAVKDAIQNGLSGLNFGEIVIGGLLGTGGTALLGSGIGKWIAKAFSGSAVAKAITAGGGTISTGLIGAAIGGIIAGIPMFITGIYDAITNGLGTLNGLLVELGATLTGAAVGLLIGGPVGAAIGALIGLAVGALTDLGLLIYEKWDEICAFFAPAVEWIDTNIIQPISNFFSELWGNISEWAINAWTSIKEFFSPAVEWFSELFGSVGQTIEDIFYNIGVIASGCWETIKIIWGTIAGVVYDNVIQPVITLFTSLWSKITQLVTSAWNAYKAVFLTVASFVNTYVIQPLIRLALNLWTDITNVFSALVGFFKGIINGVISALNSALSWIFGGINSILRELANFSIAGYSPFAGLRTISVPQIPLLASGGYVDSGQLFIAREAGAEMVGSIGNRTAVANNDQIVEGITQGVSNANDDVVTAIYAVAQQIIYAMREQDNKGGSADISRAVAQAQRNNERVYGY